MKFLCPNCKAKYQIADEKIAGRTLKMDCRRCGHAIVLRGEQPQQPPEAGARTTTGPGGQGSPAPARQASGPAVPASGSAARRPAGASRGGSHVGAAPARASQLRAGATAGSSALSADFHRSVATAPPSEAPRVTPLDQWHVAINDVPVGPMRREEIARKIAAGAVHADSLAWREGFDDWRPLRDIPELSALLRRATDRGAPPPPRGPVRTASSARIPAATSSRPAAARPAAVRPEARPDAQRPAARSNVVAIGGRLGASAAPAVEDELDELEGEPTRVASSFDVAALNRAAVEEPQAPTATSAPPAAVAPTTARASAPPAAIAPTTARASAPPVATPAPAPEAGGSTVERVSAIPDPFAAPPPPASSERPGMSSLAAARERRGLPVGAWIGIAGAMSFGVSMAVMIAPRLLGPAPQAVGVTQQAAAAAEPRPPVVAAVQTTPPVAEAPPAAAGTEQPSGTPAADESVPTPASRSGGTHAGGSAHATKTSGGGAQAATKSSSSGSVDWSRLEAEGATAGPADITPRLTTSAGGGGSRSAAGSGDLSAEQIRNVVARGRAELQRCWELEIRGMREVQTTRMDVEITIGASGTVTRAQARGVGIGNLAECIERNVRRWHFPPSGGETQTSFPLVFTGV